MPNVRKLTADEVWAHENKGKGQRKLIEEEQPVVAPTVADLRRRAQGEGELLERPQPRLWARIFRRR